MSIAIFLLVNLLNVAPVSAQANLRKQVKRSGRSQNLDVDKYISVLKLLFVCKMPGVARRQVPLFCLSIPVKGMPAKGSLLHSDLGVKIKEPNKRTPHITAFGCPVLLDNHGGCGTRPQKTLRAQTVLADNSMLACATRRDVRRLVPGVLSQVAYA